MSIKSKEIDVQTPDGVMKTFVYHPDTGSHPVVLYLMDAPSIRPALHEMAQRMAAAGYYVMMPFTYYRGSEFKEFGSSDEDMHKRRDLMRTITKPGIVSDAKALLAEAKKDPAANSNAKAGVIGFCMGGSQALAIAAALGDKIGGAASIHGGGFVTDRDDSPHKNFHTTKAELYFGWADQDAGAPKEHIEIVEKAAKNAGLPIVIDFMEGALHGFAPPGGARYNKEASEKHWERTLDMFGRTLK
jgi:carboxymethylenebutenolidase